LSVVSNQTTNTQIPDSVKNFILQFYRNVMDNNVYELHNVYDSSFNKLTEKYFQKQAWPEAEVIASLVNDGTCTNNDNNSD
jgi:translation initiation factor 3 subunit L